MIEETPQKLHFHRPDDSRRWPPEARQYVEQMVTANPKLRRTALATLIEEQSNIPYATALYWVSNAQNAKNGRDPETTPHRPEIPTGQADDTTTAPEPHLPEVDKPEPKPEMPAAPATPPPLPAPANPIHRLVHLLLESIGDHKVTRIAVTPDTVILETSPPPPETKRLDTNPSGGRHVQP